MPFPPSFPPDADVRTVMSRRPDLYHHWHEFGEGIMRGDSPFTAGERELIAGYVSGLNACAYCHGAHTAVAVAFGFPEDMMKQLLDDLDTAPIDPRLKPVLAFVRKLTLAPTTLVSADADAMFAEGWDETALHDAVAVCGYFNFMNRLVFGHGIEFNPDPDILRVKAQRKKLLGYADRGELRPEHPEMQKLMGKKH